MIVLPHEDQKDHAVQEINSLDRRRINFLQIVAASDFEKKDQDCIAGGTLQP